MLKSEYATSAEAHSANKNVCIDVTDLINYARYNNTVSGIQRVIIKIITTFVNEHGLDRVELIAFDLKKRKFIRTKATFFAGEYAYDQFRMCKHFNTSVIFSKPGLLGLRGYLTARYRNPVVYGFHFCRIYLNNKLSGGRSFAKRNISETDMLASINVPLAEWRDADFDENDLVLILGATWDFPGFVAALAEARTKKPFRIYQFIHDLIPIVIPEHMPLGVPERFKKWLDDVLNVTDVTLANSQATALDIARYAQLTGRAPLDIRTVPLAHEYVLPVPQSVAQAHISVFNDGKLKLPHHATQRVVAVAVEPYALVVGTIESRKNILRLLQIWKHLVQTQGPRTFNLILAGKSAELKNVQEFLASSGKIDGKVRIVDRPDDAEVAFLYANCQFSICLSYYEGWGLPIGESMWFGRPVLASRSSSMPEVGGDLIDYCDPADDNEIEAQLLRLMFDAGYLKKRADALDRGSMRTWDQVISKIWEEVTA